MNIYDLAWIDDEPISPRTVYQHNAIALLVFAFGVVPAFGGFGYASITIGPASFQFYWLIPGVIVWSAALIYILSVMRRRSQPRSLQSGTPVYADPPHYQPSCYPPHRLAHIVPDDCGPCTHEYPNGAAYCIYCGDKRIPAPAIGPTIKLDY